MSSFGYEVFDSSCKISTREAYGKTLEYLGGKYPNVVVLDADLSSATKTNIFRKTFPERHINCGIAEANMTGIAAGLALSGFIPFISSFAMFATGRNYEQIRNSICYPHLNVKIAATHAGITVGEDGATHQCIEDIALMRVLPGMTIIVPCDDKETMQAVEAAINYYGPVYIRLGRPAIKKIYHTDPYKFELGKGIKLREGSDLTLIGTGLGVSISLAVSEILKTYNIQVDVINIHTIKPIDEDIILRSARKTRKVVTIEEHSTIGGLGDAVADIFVKSNPAKLLKIGINDTFGFSGPINDLLNSFHLNPYKIIENITSFFYFDIKSKKI